MTQFRRLFFSVFSLASLLGTAVQARAEENTPHEPWEFDTKYVNRDSHWQVEPMKEDDETVVNEKRHGPGKTVYDVRLKKVPTEKLNKTLEESYKVNKKPEEVTKDLIALINQFNKLEGTKAISKIQLQDTTSFLVKHDEDYSTEDSKKIKFYQFMKFKFDPIVLNTLDRNGEEKEITRDRCTMVVRYEFEETQEVMEAKNAELQKEGKVYTPPLKTSVYYLDQNRGNESMMHMYKPDKTWDRMVQQ